MEKICRWWLVSSHGNNVRIAIIPFWLAILGAATKFGSQAASKKQKEPDVLKLHQENIGNPIPALAFPGFSLSKRTVVPKILDIPRAQRTALG